MLQAVEQRGMCRVLVVMIYLETERPYARVHLKTSTEGQQTRS